MNDDTGGDRIRVTVAITDDDSIERLVECVDDVLDARVVEDAESNPNRRPPVLRIDVGEVTPKQWEALELAGELGYFDRPRRVDLETLATVLSISKSAVSQRLRAAESTLIQAVVEAARESAADSSSGSGSGSGSGSDAEPGATGTDREPVAEPDPGER
ncbi:helix-turn-helix domain-containing protein [Halopiger xanaduensis]|uniref:Bacterio-opsin activator HTH domain protein n=1 Tax=Halopiger xanaduensis (strain DSM 18323 / JCM 14033 / SH-6) TaxID=797210 RepID=F8DBK8_HALXS|nr:helix-turn-helix domain-containing protein [Halopiger xanaduensis]AEH37134.1 Bacterio-opsin activator HTH domain protein [Halopiger xanaduensis SH-6]